MDENNICGLDSNSFRLQCLKLLANPYDLPVENHPQWMKPEIGAIVQIISYDTQISADECVRVSRLPYVTVKDVIPYIVKFGERYYWAYEIEVEESYLKFLQWYYDVLV